MALSNPAPWQTLNQLFKDCCQQYGERCAVIDKSDRISYSELEQRVASAHSILQEHSVQPGDRIALWAPNSWQWIVAAFAAWRSGAIVVPISSRLKAAEVLPVLQKAGAKLLFSVADCGGSNLCEQLQQYAQQQNRTLPSVLELSHLTAAARPLSAQHSAVANPAGDSPCEILYTSGTTGEPKGVTLNHQQIIQAYWDWSALGGLGENDNFLVIPPFSHGFGINAGIIACVMRGMTHIVVDFFDPARVLDLIEAENVSVMSGPPALFAALAQQKVSEARTSNALRVAYVGAAQVPEDTINSMQETLGIDRVINAYGLIEACVVSMTRADDPVSVIANSVGRPLPDVDVCIRDEHATTLPVGSSGEIWVRSYGVMQGYYNNDNATRDTIDGEGWLATGDMGFIDTEGHLHINGRRKEMYICNGFNVYPAEVENRLLSHPEVKQAAVVGISCDIKGETGIAFVVANTAADENSLQQWCREHLASYKCPQHIIFCDQLPLNANGKVMKHVLQSEAQSTLHSDK
jgi:acyl-CoA synthetase (AMP-forming)/AMP-acid ligase II